MSSTAEDTFKAQEALVSRLDESGWDLIVGDAFVRGMRDIGYKSTSYAMAELIDNSIQAGATWVDVLFGYDKGAKPNQIAVVDNGWGMEPRMARASLVWGAGTRHDNREGMGKYGYGLPSASVSQCYRVEVYSKIASGDWTMAYLDVTEIGEGKWTTNHRMTTPPEKVAEPPTFVTDQLKKLYLKPGLGSRSLTKLSVSELQPYLDRELEFGRSVRTVQKQRTVLSAALTRAQREELVIRNVAHHVELPQWQRKEIRPWSIEQLSQFLTAAREEPWYPVFVLLALYGLRRGEVLGLRWSDVDFATDTLHIRQQLQRYDGEHYLGPAKTNAGQRDLPLLAPVRAALMKMPNRPVEPTDDLIFTTRFDNPIEGGNVLRAFERISKANGLPRITLHHLRHTTATLVKNTGVPARDAQLILGHAHISTTQQLYQHADLNGQRTALTQLSQQLMAAGDRGRSRQDQPSDHVYWRLKASNNFGGSSQTRTGDTRLFRRPQHTVPNNLTEVMVLAEMRYMQHALGGAAVVLSRQKEDAQLLKIDTIYSKGRTE